MKALLQDLKIGFLFVGTIIGAGFASGRELLSFFGSLGVFLVPLSLLVGGLFFATGWLFLKVGKLIRPESFSDITRAVFGKGALVMDVLIIVSYFIVFSAMLAGVDALFAEAFGLDFGYPFFSVITAFLSVLVLLKGMNGLINANSLLVPVIVIFLFGIAVTGMLLPENTAATPLTVHRTTGGDLPLLVTNALLYVAMNMLLTASVLGSAGRGLKNRSINTGSAVGAAVITASIVLILYAIYNADMAIFDVDLPILYLAGTYGKAVSAIAAVIIWCGVFTTLTSSMYPLVEWSDKFIKRRAVSIPVILVVGFLVSLLGFSGIVNFLYPVMGAIGLFFIISSAVFYFRNRKKMTAAKALPAEPTDLSS